MEKIKDKVKSIYIHIPFCKNICNYCDFCKFYYNKNWIKKYLNELEKEIKIKYKNEYINTIYIGGGTPSMLSNDELNKLFSITKIFNLEDNYEFTIECNIEDITEEKLQIFKKNKINRLSIGIQSFNKRILKYLGRDYNIDIIDKLNLSKKYFKNINVDIMYAFENQSIKDLKEDILKIISLDIPHVSCYSLILEEHTKFYNDKIKQIDEDLDYEMYKLICKTLKDYSYNHYEISNFSKKGYESKHNLCYWNNNKYYGFGLSSSGYIEDIRYTNTKNLNKYLNGKIVAKEEKISKEDKIKYELILGFRKIKGINKNDFKEKYNINLIDVYNIKDLIDKGYLIEDKDNIFINYKYIYVCNDILVNFI